MTLAALLADAADGREDVSARAGPGGVIEYRIGELAFVVVDADGSGVFRLDPPISAAARRTPDTSASDRGPEWVRFSPVDLDPHAADRARAWFEAAARRARTG